MEVAVSSGHHLFLRRLGLNRSSDLPSRLPLLLSQIAVSTSKSDAPTSSVEDDLHARPPTPLKFTCICFDILFANTAGCP
ncbi:unnamed protein product [Toxocara canis]|uniref:Ovule protein n=1 Tax=Toxocara canis TaxID=6265 RepID=A0A183UZE8_TOXCA|nr:unnamed protein product [Toxocara canis]